MIRCPYQPCSFRIPDLIPDQSGESQREWYEHITKAHKDRLGATMGSGGHGKELQDHFLLTNRR